MCLYSIASVAFEARVNQRVHFIPFYLCNPRFQSEMEAELCHPLTRTKRSGSSALQR
jgi:hypothetical protein